MQHLIQSHQIVCPFCFESIELVVDESAGEQEYIEDCSVCCRPISIRVSESWEGEGKWQVNAERGS